MNQASQNNGCVPETSTTLLRDMASDARWPEFVARYRPMMLGYLKTRFPVLDADDMVQDTLIALSRALPHYRYAPDETGRFRNYLTGILHNKALKQCEKDRKERAMKSSFLQSAQLTAYSPTDSDISSWQTSLLEIAMEQLLSDEKIPDQSKQIFQRLTVDGTPPDDVAAAYGISRNSVDKTKSRMMARLRRIVRALEAVGDV